MVKLIWTFHGLTFHGLTYHGLTFHGGTFSGQDVSFPYVSGPDKSLTGRFVGLPMKILPHVPYALRSSKCINYMGLDM